MVFSQLLCQISKNEEECIFLFSSVKVDGLSFFFLGQLSGFCFHSSLKHLPAHGKYARVQTFVPQSC